jgi:predicted RNase H-like nuclease (RuvC/YqgF family)
LIETLEAEADELDKSRAQHIRDILKDRDSTADDERITELEKELDSVRMDRERLRGKAEALEDQLEDLRGYRDNVSAELARAPAIEAVEEDGEVVVEEEEDEESGWWPW